MCDTNWYQVRREYRHYTIDDWEQGNIEKTQEGMETYASQTASCSQYVIYTAYQRELWADSQDIRDYEDDAVACGLTSVTDIQEHCVWMWLTDAISETLNELYQKEAVDYVRTATKYYYSELAGNMSIPVLVIDQHIEGE